MTDLKANNSSLIQAENQQLKLFGSDQMDAAFFAYEESVPTPEFTGERLFKNKPEVYHSITALSAEGLGVKRIGRILHVSPNTVLAVRAREPESIDTEKRRIARLSREGARMCVEGIVEMLCDPVQIKKISVKDLGIVFGILAEKHELLSGSPTARLQTIGDPNAVGILEHMRWAKEEYERRMDCAARKTEQRTAAEADPDTDEEPAIVAPGPVQRKPIALLEAHKGTVGQTPHRTDENPANIDRNDAADSTSNNTILPKAISHSEQGAKQI